MSTQTDMIRRDKDALLNELVVYGAVVRGGAIKCPFHDDQNPSAGVYSQDGVWRFRCHGCGFHGDIFDVRAEGQKRPVADVLKDQDPQRTRIRTYNSLKEITGSVDGTVEQIFRYKDMSGKTVLAVIRFTKDGKKSFRQVSTLGNKLIMKSPKKPWILYNLQQVVSADRVVVVEGEKCADVLNRLGITATTSPCGAGNAKHTDWSPLAGKDVVLFPDNDMNGFGHMEQIRKILQRLNPEPAVREIDPADLGLEKKQDVADLVADFSVRNNPEQVRILVEEALKLAKGTGASTGVAQLVEDVISGKRVSIRFPFSQLSSLTNALLPATVTLVCGDAGSAKSFFMIQCMVHWIRNGIQCAIFELEESTTYHLHRVLAQETGTPHLMDCDWIKCHPEESREAVAGHSEVMDQLGKCIWDAPDRQMTQAQVAEWITKRAEEGNRIIVVDPITACEPDSKPWISDNKFMMRVKKVCLDHQCSLILVTHPKKGRKDAIGLDELSGGASFNRFSQTVLWVHHLEEYKRIECKTDVGRAVIDCNKVVHMNKTRNGKGHGMKIGFRFGQDLKFAEQGVVTNMNPKEE